MNASQINLFDKMISLASFVEMLQHKIPSVSLQPLKWTHMLVAAMIWALCFTSQHGVFRPTITISMVAWSHGTS